MLVGAIPFMVMPFVLDLPATQWSIGHGLLFAYVAR